MGCAPGKVTGRSERSAVGSRTAHRGIAAACRRGSALCLPAESMRPICRVKVHREYIRAGADVVSANCYNISAAAAANGKAFRTPESRSKAPPSSGPVEPNFAELERRLLADAVGLAKEVVGNCDAGGGPVVVAAALGPYGTCIPERSETANRVADNLEWQRRPGYGGLDRSVLEQFHSTRAAAVLEAGAELLMFETVPDLLEAEAICSVLDSDGIFADVDAVVTFTCRERADGVLVADNGAPAVECIEAAARCRSVVAVGFNCIEPRLACKLLAEAKAVTDKPLVCYPNSGEAYDSKLGWRQDLCGPEVGDEAGSLADMAGDWLAAGASVVGGCCRIGPAEIAALSARFPRHEL